MSENNIQSKKLNSISINVNSTISVERIGLNSNKSIESIRGKDIEATVIKLKINQNYILFTISAYAARNYQPESFLKLVCLCDGLNLYDPGNRYDILAGDLNTKHTEWQSEINKPKGSLKKWLHENEISLRAKLFRSPLSSFPRGNFFLDVCLANQSPSFHIKDDLKTKIKSLPYNRDHIALKISIAILCCLPCIPETSQNGMG